MLAHTRQFPTSLARSTSLFLRFRSSRSRLRSRQLSRPGRSGDHLFCQFGPFCLFILQTHEREGGVGEDCVHNIESACRRAADVVVLRPTPAVFYDEFVKESNWRRRDRCSSAWSSQTGRGNTIQGRKGLKRFFLCLLW